MTYDCVTYDCMTADELALWREGAVMVARRSGYLTAKPCADCPLAFRLAEHAAGRCCLPEPVAHSGVEARRAYNREWMRLSRARQLGQP